MKTSASAITKVLYTRYIFLILSYNIIKSLKTLKYGRFRYKIRLKYVLDNLNTL